MLEGSSLSSNAALCLLSPLVLPRKPCAGFHEGGAATMLIGRSLDHRRIAASHPLLATLPQLNGAFLFVWDRCHGQALFISRLFQVELHRLVCFLPG